MATALEESASGYFDPRLWSRLRHISLGQAERELQQAELSGLVVSRLLVEEDDYRILADTRVMGERIHPSDYDYVVDSSITIPVEPYNTRPVYVPRSIVGVSR